MNTGKNKYAIHNPSYDFNDKLIPVAVKYNLQLVEDFFKAKK